MWATLIRCGVGPVFALLASVTVAHAQVDSIGTVRTTEGTAVIIRDDERSAAELGLPVWQGDILETGADGALGIVFRDSSSIALGPNSHLTLKDFRFEPARDDLSFLASLLRGSLLYVSGVIAKLSRDSVALETPVATIGMRGTRFLARVEE